MLRSGQSTHSNASAAALRQRKGGVQKCTMFARYYFFPSPFLVSSFVSNIYLCQVSIVYYSILFVVVMKSMRKKRLSHDLRFLPEVEALFLGWFSCTCTPSAVVLWEFFFISLSWLSCSLFFSFREAEQVTFHVWKMFWHCNGVLIAFFFLIPNIFIRIEEGTIEHFFS